MNCSRASTTEVEARFRPSRAWQRKRSRASQPIHREAPSTVGLRPWALAAAHDVLTAEQWVPASLHELIAKAGVGCGAQDGPICPKDRRLVLIG